MFLIAPLRLLAWMVNKLADIIDDIQNAYVSNLKNAVDEEVRKAFRVSGLKRTDLSRILPTIYDAAKFYHSLHWWPLLLKALRSRTRTDATDPPHGRLRSLGTGEVFMAFVFGGGMVFLVGWLWITILWAGISVPRFAGLTATLLTVAIYVYLILAFVRAAVVSRLPSTYITLAVVIQFVFASLVIHTYHGWSPSVNDAWQSLHSSISIKYRVLIPRTKPSIVILVAVWLTAIECIIRFHIRIIRYIGTQLSVMTGGGHGRGLRGYSSLAGQSATLIVYFIRVSYSLSEWELNLPPETSSDLKDIASRIPSAKMLGEIDTSLSRIALILNGYWRDALRSSPRTPGRRSVGQRMAREAVRIEHFFQYQRIKIILGSANLVKLREEMTKALVHSADGDWYLIGRGEEYEMDATAAQWKTVVRRFIAIAIPIGVAIGVSEFAHKVPAPYIQAILLTCIGFAVVQFLGLIDPDAPTRLDVAGRLSNILKR